LTPQWLVLDHRSLLAYYGCCVALGFVGLACARGIPSIAPTGLELLEHERLLEWLAPYRRSNSARYDLKWRFVNQKGETAGRAAVRIAPPDTVRFDYRGPFGRSGAALIVGDSALWFVPERETRDLVPAAPLFWVALGLPRPPPSRAALFGRERDSEHAWRYATDADTADFVETGTGPDHLLAEVRRDGRMVASIDVRFRPGTRLPAETRLRFPQDGSALLLTVEGIQNVAAFDPNTWHRP
jgi:hypothetical protein